MVVCRSLKTIQQRGCGYLELISRERNTPQSNLFLDPMLEKWPVRDDPYSFLTKLCHITLFRTTGIQMLTTEKVHFMEPWMYSICSVSGFENLHFRTEMTRMQCYEIRAKVCLDSSFQISGLEWKNVGLVLLFHQHWTQDLSLLDPFHTQSELSVGVLLSLYILLPLWRLFPCYLK